VKATCRNCDHFVQRDERIFCVTCGDKASWFKSKDDAQRCYHRGDDDAMECHEWVMPKTEDGFEGVLKTTVPKDVVVKVVDKDLLADGRFEDGVSYVMEELNPKDNDMISVYDKFGEKRDYFRNRFVVAFE